MHKDGELGRRVCANCSTAQNKKWSSEHIHLLQPNLQVSQICDLTFTTLWANSADENVKPLFSGKYKKNISIYRLLKFFFLECSALNIILEQIYMWIYPSVVQRHCDIVLDHKKVVQSWLAEEYQTAAQEKLYKQTVSF